MPDPDDDASSSDEALMTAFAERGEARAFEILVRRYRRPLFTFLVRYVGDAGRTEELVQEVFLRVVRNRHRYRATGRFSTYLFQIARNLSVDESRRAKFRRHRSLDAPAGRGEDGRGRSLLEQIPAEGRSPDQAVGDHDLRGRILAAVDTLPAAQKEVFLLRVAAGLSFVEIAQTLGVSDNTVKSRMRYALEKLRVQLADVAPDFAEGKEGAS